MLKTTFIELLANYSANEEFHKDLWAEIEDCYSCPSRHYHTLEHLGMVLRQLEQVKQDIQNWDAVLFSLFYHDVIYNASATNNEERSAELAGTRMKQLSISDSIILASKQQILDTKAHTRSTSTDNNYFTDADLAILGQDWEVYTEYYRNIRNEYIIYPETVYNPGRRNVLVHFLTMPRIFKTDYFLEKFETAARRNMQRELKTLL